MSDKFEKLSIYDVDMKLVDDDGVEQVFTFKPLPFATYPRVYDLVGKLNGLNTDDNEESFMKLLDKDLMDELLNVELEMVLNSYPNMDKLKAEIFVISNSFQLIEPLIAITFKQEKANPRKMSLAKNE